MYVYIRSEPGSYTVGFYTPTGKWESESDHNEREEAAKRCAWLNGSGKEITVKESQDWDAVFDPGTFNKDNLAEVIEILKERYFPPLKRTS